MSQDGNIDTRMVAISAFSLWTRLGLEITRSDGPTCLHVRKQQVLVWINSMLPETGMACRVVGASSIHYLSGAGTPLGGLPHLLTDELETVFASVNEREVPAASLQCCHLVAGPPVCQPRSGRAPEGKVITGVQSWRAEESALSEPPQVISW